LVVLQERTEHLGLPPWEQQVPQPGTEAALRHHLESLAQGAPDFEQLTPELVQAMRSQMKGRSLVERFGRLRSLTFRGSRPLPGKQPILLDQFAVELERQRFACEIALDAGGKITLLALRLVDVPPERAPSDTELVSQLRQRLDFDAETDSFAGSVLLVHGDEVLLDEARGLADRERSVPMRTDTRLRIGSMSEMFTAVAVLQLAEAGRLQLDDALSTHLPEYPNQELARSVRLRHLLTHTGGTGEIFGPEFAAHRAELTSHQAYIDRYAGRTPKFPPGGGFEYSNYGFLLLGRVIERASGQSYDDYVREHIFEPAGMSRTGSRPESEAVEGRAVAYRWAPQGPVSNADTLPPMGTAAGGGYSTTGDLLRFVRALQQRHLLSEQSTRALLGEQLNAGDVHSGYGFSLFEQRGHRGFGHNGGAPGMNGDLQVYPDSGHVLVVLSNLDPPSARDLSEFASGRLFSKPAAEVASAALPSPPPNPPSNGPNLLPGGNSEAGLGLWGSTLLHGFVTPLGEWKTSYLPVGHAETRVTRGALCTTVQGGQNVALAWEGAPDVSFEPKKRYHLQFRMSSSGPLPVHATVKVGCREPPWTYVVRAPIPVTDRETSYAVDFLPSYAEARGGVAFVLSAPRSEQQSEVCLGDITLVGG